MYNGTVNSCGSVVHIRFSKNEWSAGKRKMTRGNLMREPQVKPAGWEGLDEN